MIDRRDADRPAAAADAGDAADAADAADELSVQLYTVREALAADTGATLGRLAALGFRRVEPFDLLTFRDRLGPALAEHGLAAPTTHAGLLDADPGPALDAAAALGIGTVIQPWTDPDRWQTADGIARLADALNAVVPLAAGRGLRIGYHNHHFELAARIGDRHALEVFVERLAPAVVLEVDTYWAYAGGANVPALLERLGDRVVALHVKDGDGSLDTSRQVAVGSGTLPIRAIVDAAPRALRVVELDGTVGDLFEALAASRAFLLDGHAGRDHAGPGR